MEVVEQLSGMHSEQLGHGKGRENDIICTLPSTSTMNIPTGPSFFIKCTSANLRRDIPSRSVLRHGATYDTASGVNNCECWC